MMYAAVFIQALLPGLTGQSRENQPHVYTNNFDIWFEKNRCTNLEKAGIYTCLPEVITPVSFIELVLYGVDVAIKYIVVGL